MHIVYADDAETNLTSQQTQPAVEIEETSIDGNAYTMTLWQAVVIGVVEGLTEYLPVSSTGHILLAQRAIGISLDDPESEKAANAYAVVIQVGAILAVLGIFWQRIWSMLKGLVGKDPDGLKMLIMVCVAFSPAAIIGIFLDDLIESHLFGLWPITAAWFVGGIAILVVEWYRLKKSQAELSEQPLENDIEPAESKGIELSNMTWWMALVIGFSQCLAMWPGTSRSLVTILGGVLIGLKLRAAVEFSFLLGFVTLSAATLYKGIEAGPVMLDVYGVLPMVVGIVAAGISAFAAVKWMVGYLNKHSLMIFGWYRVFLALVVVALLLFGILQSN